MKKYDPEREARAARADMTSAALAKQFLEGYALMDIIDTEPSGEFDHQMRMETPPSITRRESIRRMVTDPLAAYRSFYTPWW